MPGFDHFSEADYDEHLDAFLRDRPEDRCTSSPTAR